MVAEGNVKERKAVVIRIPVTMHKRIRHIAIEESITVNELVTQLLVDRIGRAKKGAA